MNIDSIIERMKSKPYLLDMGAGNLARRFKCDRDIIYQAKAIVRGVRVKPNLPKILILDIETSPLKSYTWGLWKQDINLSQIVSDWFCLTWACKYLDEDILFSNKLTPEEVKKEDDKRIMNNLWEHLDNSDIVIAHNGCVASGNKILKSNFTWENVENLKVGDKLIAFDEEIDRKNNTNTPRKYKISEVLYCKPIIKECSKIEFFDGSSIIASNDHPWLTRFSYKNAHWKYIKTEELNLKNRNNILTKVIKPWEPDLNTYHSGYLAGFFDADGALSQHQRRGRKNGFTFTVTFCQKDPLIIKKLEESLNYYNFKYSMSSYDRKHGDIKNIRILGGLSEKLRFLGIVNPQKLQRLDLDKFSQLKMSGHEDLEIKSVTPIGLYEVIGLETSSKTYIVNGFPCHNSSFDIPRINTRFIVNGIVPPSPYKQIDTLKVARSQFNFSSNKLDHLAKCFDIEGKYHTGFELWSKCLDGDNKALAEMETYNRHDVEILEEVYLNLRPWMKSHMNVSLYNDSEELQCSHCGSTSLIKTGSFWYTHTGKYPIYRCNECGAHSKERKSIGKKKFLTSIPGR